ncbi:MAG TPA: hypothetical protein PLH94_11615 [Fimbriimonadaceae bacterium]|nr:hypothetical protein [Fimbriimonadaceae bacterium]
MEFSQNEAFILIEDTDADGTYDAAEIILFQDQDGDGIVEATTITLFGDETEEEHGLTTQFVMSDVHDLGIFDDVSYEDAWHHDWSTAEEPADKWDNHLTVDEAMDMVEVNTYSVDYGY